MFHAYATGAAFLSIIWSGQTKQLASDLAQCAEATATT
jgi:hypothetical protein